MPLQTFEGYTVDYRLSQFRRFEGDHGEIEFIDFRSEEGDAILCRMIKQNVVDFGRLHL